MIYLCLLSIMAAGLSLSRYTSNDTAVSDSGVALYDVFITGGDPSSVQTEIAISVCATSKLSEPVSMIDGTYQKVQLNITNRSECAVALSDFLLSAPDGSVYNKVIIPKDEAEMAEYELKCGSIPLAVIDYLGKSRVELSQMSIEQINTAISDSNTKTCNSLELSRLSVGETKTLFVIAWVEHDGVYKADADLNEDKISHQTPTELGVLPEKFTFSVHSEQID